MDVLETDLGTEKEPIRYAIEFVGVMELENQVGLVVRANPHRGPVVGKSFLTPPIGLSQHFDTIHGTHNSPLQTLLYLHNLTTQREREREDSS